MDRIDKATFNKDLLKNCIYHHHTMWTKIGDLATALKDTVDVMEVKSEYCDMFDFFMPSDCMGCYHDTIVGFRDCKACICGDFHDVGCLGGLYSKILVQTDDYNLQAKLAYEVAEMPFTNGYDKSLITDWRCDNE